MESETYPKRAASPSGVTISSVLIWVGLGILAAFGIAGAAMCYQIGTMYGFDINGAKRTTDVLNVATMYLAAGAFLAFPSYLAGQYTGGRHWTTAAIALLVVVPVALLLMWWF
mgnify:CR=1 FL=1